MSTKTGKIFRFGQFEVQDSARILRRGVEIVPLNRRAFDVLLYFVQNPGRALTHEELLRSVWSEAFVDENSLTQSISVLRRALQEKHGKSNFIATLPGRGYQFVSDVSVSTQGIDQPDSSIPAADRTPVLGKAEQQGFPLATATNEKFGPASPTIWSLRIFTFIVALSLLVTAVVSYLSWRSFRSTAHIMPRRVMLAVLPFINFTGDPSQEFLSDGLTEEMIAQLGEINHEGLGIIARTSAMSYKGSAKSVAQIGKELAVDYLLEGSVRRWGDRIRISAQLIKTSDQTPIWSQNFETDSHDILKLQSEVAEAIAEHINLALTPEQKARVRATPQVDPRVYELYLLGRYEWNKRTAVGLNQAIAHFQQAMNSDPKYAPAYAGLAQAYVLLPYYGGVSEDAATSKAKSLAEESLRLDSSMVEAHATLGFILVSRFNWSAAGVEYRRALQLNPNYSTARQWYSFYLWITKGHDQALEELDRARQLDPLSLIINTDEARLLCAVQQTDRAISLLQKAIALDANFAEAHRSLALAYTQKGQFSEAIAEARQGVALDPNDYEEATLGYIYGVAGKPEQARKILALLSDKTRKRTVSPVYRSFVLIGLGEKDRAFACLEDAYGERSSLLLLLQFETVFAALRSDPRFSEIWLRISEAKAD